MTRKTAYNEDDGYKIEPEFYVPILPMILVNGTKGIGTGFSTNIPSHNPLDIIKNLENMMEGKEVKMMKPWFRGFEGDVTFKKVNEFGYDIYSNKGKYVKLSDTKIQITELPIGTWTEKYKEDLEELVYDFGNGNLDGYDVECLFKSYISGMISLSHLELNL